MSRGFTLVEVLLSLGVFAIGMIAVASLFPVAAILQRETAKEVIAQNAAASAEAMMNARPLTYGPPVGATPATGNLANYYSFAGPNLTNAVPLHTLNATLLTQRMPPADRSYPTAQVIYGSPTDISNCDLHWVPFVQDLSGNPNGSGQNWVVRLFLLETDSRANYPASGPGNSANPNDGSSFPQVVWTNCSVSNNVFTLSTSTHGLRSGDVVMDSNGNEHHITAVNGAAITVRNKIPASPAAPTVVWYAPPYGASSSPSVGILTVSIDVAAP